MRHWSLCALEVCPVNAGIDFSQAESLGVVCRGGCEVAAASKADMIAVAFPFGPDPWNWTGEVENAQATLCPLCRVGHQEAAVVTEHNILEPGVELESKAQISGRNSEH